MIDNAIYSICDMIATVAEQMDKEPENETLQYEMDVLDKVLSELLLA